MSVYLTELKNKKSSYEKYVQFDKAVAEIYKKTKLKTKMEPVESN